MENMSNGSRTIEPNIYPGTVRRYLVTETVVTTPTWPECPPTDGYTATFAFIRSRERSESFTISPAVMCFASCAWPKRVGSGASGTHTHSLVVCCGFIFFLSSLLFSQTLRIDRGTMCPLCKKPLERFTELNNQASKDENRSKATSLY